MKAAAAPGGKWEVNAENQLLHGRNQTGDSPLLENSRALGALLILVTFGAYASTLAFGFVFDDPTQILGNPWIQSWKFVPQYFAHHVFAFKYPHLLANSYRPVFLLWLRLNEALFGFTAWKWHLANVLLHAGVTVLFFQAARKICRDTWTACLAALLFGLHPVHVEVAAYISASPESLGALGFFGAFLAFVVSWQKAGRGQHWLWMLLSLGCFVEGVLAKETVQVLPAVIMVYCWLEGPPAATPDRNGWARAVTAFVVAAPYLVIEGLYLVARNLALCGLAHVLTPLPLKTLLLTAPSVLCFYLKLLVWPARLSPYYDTPYVETFSRHGFWIPLAVEAVVTLGIGGWYLFLRKKRDDPVAASESRALLLTFVLFALPILPVLNLRYFSPGEIAHDRYLYLPSAGFCLLAAMLLARVPPGGRRIMGKHALQVAVALMACAVLAASTLVQSLKWSDELSLDTRAHQIAPQNLAATTSLAAAAAGKGLYPAAITLYEEVLARDPSFWRASVNLAYIYYGSGNLPQAERYFRQSIASDPTDGDQFAYLGATLLQMRRPEEAEDALRKALLVHPDGANYHYFLGLVLRSEGKLPDALRELQQELALNPQHKNAAMQAAETQAELQKESSANKDGIPRSAGPPGLPSREQK